LEVTQHQQPQSNKPKHSPKRDLEYQPAMQKKLKKLDGHSGVLYDIKSPKFGDIEIFSDSSEKIKKKNRSNDHSSQNLKLLEEMVKSVGESINVMQNAEKNKNLDIQKLVERNAEQEKQLINEKYENIMGKVNLIEKDLVHKVAGNKMLIEENASSLKVSIKDMVGYWENKQKKWQEALEKKERENRELREKFEDKLQEFESEKNRTYDQLLNKFMEYSDKKEQRYLDMLNQYRQASTTNFEDIKTKFLGLDESVKNVMQVDSKSKNLSEVLNNAMAKSKDEILNQVVNILFERDQVLWMKFNGLEIGYDGKIQQVH